MTYLAEGDLARARAVLAEAPKQIEPAALVAQVAQYYDLTWVLDDAQRRLLLSLEPGAFDDDEPSWALNMAVAYALQGDQASCRKFAEKAIAGFQEQLRQGTKDPQRDMALALALAYAGQKDDAIRQGMKAVAGVPLSKDGYTGVYVQHQFARLYILVGEPEKALEQLEPLLNVPYILTPAWLKIDPTFDPLRKNPRFQRLVAGAK